MLSNYGICKLLLPLDGANNGTAFPDWSPTMKQLSVGGNAKTVTSLFKFYDSSAYFDGDGDYLGASYHSDFNFSTVDFTISAYARLIESGVGNHVYPAIFGKRNTGVDWDLGLWSNGQKLFLSYGDVASPSKSIVSPVSSFLNNTWYHVAVVRSGSTLYLFINGVAAGSGAITTNILNRALGFYIGHSGPSFADSSWYGYIQDFVFLRGIALWTSDFTPPARLIGEIAGVVRDKDNAPASRIITACPRTNPTRAFSTVSDAGTGAYTLRVPSTEVTRIALADELTVYNDLAARILPE